MITASCAFLLRGLEREVDVHLVIWEDDFIAFLLQDPRIQQGGDVAMYGFDVPVDAPGCFPDRQRAGTSECAQDIPAFQGEHFQQQSDRFVSNEVALLPAQHGPHKAVLDGVSAGNSEGHGIC